MVGPGLSDKVWSNKQQMGLPLRGVGHFPGSQISSHECKIRGLSFKSLKVDGGVLFAGPTGGLKLLEKDV